MCAAMYTGGCGRWILEVLDALEVMCCMQLSLLEVLEVPEVTRRVLL